MQVLDAKISDVSECDSDPDTAIDLDAYCTCSTSNAFCAITTIGTHQAPKPLYNLSRIIEKPGCLALAMKSVIGGNPMLLLVIIHSPDSFAGSSACRYRLLLEKVTNV